MGIAAHAETERGLATQMDPTRRLEARVRELEEALAEKTERLEKSEAHAAELSAIVDGAPLAIYLKDATHHYRLVNREYERLAGAGREHILGREDFALFTQEVATLFREQDLEVRAHGGPREFRETIPLPDGIHSFITIKFPVRTASGEHAGVAGVCTEITALEGAKARLAQAQDALVHKERLAALGELSAVVAHEVRNPLGVIFNAVGALRHSAQVPPHDLTLLDLVQEEAERLNHIVGALLELARPTPPHPEPTSVAEVVTGAVQAARGWVNPPEPVTLDVGSEPAKSRVDAQMLHTAVTNLISNALASPGRKRPVAVRVHGDAERVIIEVADDGAGVPPELAERIFEPFFTTRAKGTGLGLALVRRVAEAHGGAVSVRQTPGGGATFLLELAAAR
jgi:PAS domain S-box-containing protein